MSARRQAATRFRWLPVVLAVLGLVALLVSLGVTVEWAERHLTADGWLSGKAAVRLMSLRWALLFSGALLLLAAGWASRRLVARAVAVLVAALFLLAFVQRTYPRHLLLRPERLIRSVLGLDLALRDYDPKAALHVASHEVLQARYPAINIHAHFSYPGPDTIKSAEELLAVMDACNVAQAIDLDGDFRKEIEQYARKAPDRLLVFAHVWFGERFPSAETLQRVAESLEEAKRLGVRGIKIWKNLGLHSRDKEGRVVPVDDPRLEPLWTKAAALDLPILIHLSDPEPFFQPVDAHNERYEELAYVSGKVVASLAGPHYPRTGQIMEQFERVLDRHPGVTFIGAHMLMLGHDLERLAGVLDRHPNLFVDISAMGHELGRQPRAARAFFLRYQDRILFGTDGNPDETGYRQYFRFLETADEYFDYPGWPKYHPGRWKIYGLDLPDGVLRKVYHDNAARILTGGNDHA